ncbi:MOSC domain-containing protein [Thiothrix unzii]|uniref:MOSC N-terminal beta barrel domain-containing protein n=1 Tax=Thiothrix unzii TaxID=111769 RepID=A0A975IH81_9GAMM|nr:MOSC N-terminal beta barrel domain-containing protein [Thiothrix unzii]QTR53647.1 MOSC N-terminal beta barrel domain-containing protein [Thiothrix unzii]
MFTISSLHIYPVKSLQGIALSDAVLTMQGLAFDRQWMLVDAAGKFVTQRQMPALARISTRLTAECLVLEHAGLPPLSIPLVPMPDNRCAVTVWRDTCMGCDEGAAASHWLTQAVGQWQGGDLRLVRFAPEGVRPVDPAYMDGDSADTAFSDGYPFLIVSEASLAAVNVQLLANGAEAVPMARFRPNIVLSGMSAFGENDCKTFTATDASYRFTLRKPCQRCKTTTVDQRTGVIANPKEPLRTLTAMNPYPHLSGAYFGQNATLTLGHGVVIKVGDQVQ